MSWESSAAYYRIINETVRDRLGPLYSAKSLMYTVNFHDIERLQHAGRWDEAAEVLVDAATRLERGGADCLVICTNTMHKLAGHVEAAVKIPLIHIADATARKIQAKKLEKVGLLGTAFTMEQNFYKGRLTEKFGLEVIVPDDLQTARSFTALSMMSCVKARLSPSPKRNFYALWPGLWHVARKALS